MGLVHAFFSCPGRAAPVGGAGRVRRALLVVGWVALLASAPPQAGARFARAELSHPEYRGGEAHRGERAGSEERGSDFGEAGELTGISAMALLSATAATGLLMRGRWKAMRPAHRWLALAAVLAGLLHGGLTLFGGD